MDYCINVMYNFTDYHVMDSSDKISYTTNVMMLAVKKTRDKQIIDDMIDLRDILEGLSTMVTQNERSVYDISVIPKLVEYFTPSTWREIKTTFEFVNRLSDSNCCNRLDHINTMTIESLQIYNDVVGKMDSIFDIFDFLHARTRTSSSNILNTTGPVITLSTSLLTISVFTDIVKLIHSIFIIYGRTITNRITNIMSIYKRSSNTKAQLKKKNFIRAHIHINSIHQLILHVLPSNGFDNTNIKVIIRSLIGACVCLNHSHTVRGDLHNLPESKLFTSLYNSSFLISAIKMKQLIVPISLFIESDYNESRNKKEPRICMEYLKRVYDSYMGSSGNKKDFDGIMKEIQSNAGNLKSFIKSPPEERSTDGLMNDLEKFSLIPIDMDENIDKLESKINSIQSEQKKQEVIDLINEFKVKYYSLDLGFNNIEDCEKNILSEDNIHEFTTLYSADRITSRLSIENSFLESRNFDSVIKSTLGDIQKDKLEEVQQIYQRIINAVDDAINTDRDKKDVDLNIPDTFDTASGRFKQLTDPTEYQIVTGYAELIKSIRSNSTPIFKSGQHFKSEHNVIQACKANIKTRIDEYNNSIDKDGVKAPHVDERKLLILCKILADECEHPIIWATYTSISKSIELYPNEDVKKEFYKILISCLFLAWIDNFHNGRTFSNIFKMNNGQNIRTFSEIHERDNDKIFSIYPYENPLFLSKLSTFKRRLKSWLSTVGNVKIKNGSIGPETLPKFDTMKDQIDLVCNDLENAYYFIHEELVLDQKKKLEPITSRYLDRTIHSLVKRKLYKTILFITLGASGLAALLFYIHSKKEYSVSATRIFNSDLPYVNPLYKVNVDGKVGTFEMSTDPLPLKKFHDETLEKQFERSYLMDEYKDVRAPMFDELKMMTAQEKLYWVSHSGGNIQKDLLHRLSYHFPISQGTRYYNNLANNLIDTDVMDTWRNELYPIASQHKDDTDMMSRMFRANEFVLLRKKPESNTLNALWGLLYDGFFFWLQGREQFNTFLLEYTLPPLFMVMSMALLNIGGAGKSMVSFATSYIMVLLGWLFIWSPAFVDVLLGLLQMALSSVSYFFVVMTVLVSVSLGFALLFTLYGYIEDLMYKKELYKCAKEVDAFVYEQKVARKFRYIRLDSINHYAKVLRDSVFSKENEETYIPLSWIRDTSKNKLGWFSVIFLSLYYGSAENLPLKIISGPVSVLMSSMLLMPNLFEAIRSRFYKPRNISNVTTNTPQETPLVYPLEPNKNLK